MVTKLEIRPGTGAKMTNDCIVEKIVKATEPHAGDGKYLTQTFYITWCWFGVKENLISSQVARVL